MKYLLDTNTLSFAMAGESAVCERLLSLSRTDVLVPQPVIAEIRYGLERLPESKKKKRLTERFEVLLSEMHRASWTDDVSLAFGVTKADLESRGIRIEDFDVAIAAHALAIDDGILVTDNLDHMARVSNLRVENWRDRSQ